MEMRNLTAGFDPNPNPNPKFPNPNPNWRTWTGFDEEPEDWSKWFARVLYTEEGDLKHLNLRDFEMEIEKDEARVKEHDCATLLEMFSGHPPSLMKIREVMSKMSIIELTPEEEFNIMAEAKKKKGGAWSYIGLLPEWAIVEDGRPIREYMHAPSLLVWAKVTGHPWWPALINLES